jgi:hypothetical protein
VADERQRHGRLLAREDDVEGFNSECAVSPLSVIDGAHRFPDPFAMAQR